MLLLLVVAATVRPELTLPLLLLFRTAHSGPVVAVPCLFALTVFSLHLNEIFSAPFGFWLVFLGYTTLLAFQSLASVHSYPEKMESRSARATATITAYYDQNFLFLISQNTFKMHFTLDYFVSWKQGMKRAKLPPPSLNDDLRLRAMLLR